MRAWNLSTGDPLQLTLACDARLQKPDFFNDHIWELKLAGSEPPGLNLQTTFGLRAKTMRFFPRFTWRENSISNPLEFADKPAILAFFPNYISCVFSPFKGFKARAEYWVPESHAISGRIQITNETDLAENITLQWVAILNPFLEGESMNIGRTPAGEYLKGRAANLIPVCIFEEKPSSSASPFPSLVSAMDLKPGESKSIKWAAAALTQENDSLDLARKICSRSWDAEIARIELTNASQMVEISTGNRDWDAALSLSQKTASSLLIFDQQNPETPPFVLSRQPDHGYSIRSNGSDYPGPWKDQSLLDACYLIDSLLPGAVEAGTEFVKYFYKRIGGNPSGKSGLAVALNQQPLLASLISQVDDYKTGHEWLEELFPLLFTFYQSWFDPSNDRDQDGFPEWKNDQQTGLPDSPLYDRRNPESQGTAVNTLESPSLLSFLYREGTRLVRIWRHLGRTDTEKWLKQQTEKIQQAMENCWNNKRSMYQYRDFESHLSLPSQPIASFQASGVFAIRSKVSPVQRVMIRLATADENTRTITMTIEGKINKIPLSEKLSTLDFSWFNGRAYYTSKNLYTRIDRLDIAGLQENDAGSICTVDTSANDISLFLPLWAGAISSKHADLIIENNLKPLYILPHGIPTHPDKKYQVTHLNMLWNAMIIDGLLNYGYRDLAVEIFEKLIEAVILNLKKHNAFFERYDCYTAEPAGMINHLHGILPTGLFLRILGVKYISTERILLDGNNPFPWPIILQYRGIKIVCNSADTIITFPTGQTITASGPGPFEVRR